MTEQQIVEQRLQLLDSSNANLTDPDDVARDCRVVMEEMAKRNSMVVAVHRHQDPVVYVHQKEHVEVTDEIRDYYDS